jgi:hypothetical protein
MRTAIVLLTTLAAYIGIENLIFNSGWYAKIVSPDSSTGQVGEHLYNEHKRVKIGKQVLAIGDSRMAFFPRYVNAKPGIHYTFGSIAVAGSTPRDWYYMFREADPTHRQYSAIVIPMEDYEDVETWEHHADRETDLHYIIALLRWTDLFDFAGSYDSPELKAKAALGIVLKGSVYRADFQDLLAHRRARLDYVRLARRDSANWIYDYVGTDYNVSGIKINWQAKTLLVPPGHHADERSLFEPRLFAPPAPDIGRRSAYLKHWLNRIYDMYRGTGTRIVFFRLPRGPYLRPDQPARNENSSVRELARQPGVILDDEHYFESLERPELFMDPMHLNGAGAAEFSTMLGKHVQELLEK